MRSLLIEGQLILEALQGNTPSEFDLLWAVLQSPEVQGYISQTDLNHLFVEMARSQGIDIASSMAHHLSQVLRVYSSDETLDFDFRISTESELFIESAEKLPMLSVSAYLERLTLDLVYRNQLASSKNHKVLTKWMRKYSEVSVDPFLAIPLALTFLMQGLGVFDKFLGLDLDQREPMDRFFSIPSVKFLARHKDKTPLILPPSQSSVESLALQKQNLIDEAVENSPFEISDNETSVFSAPQSETNTDIVEDILEPMPFNTLPGRNRIRPQLFNQTKGRSHFAALLNPKRLNGFKGGQNLSDELKQDEETSNSQTSQQKKRSIQNPNTLVTVLPKASSEPDLTTSITDTVTLEQREEASEPQVSITTPELEPTVPEALSSNPPIDDNADPLVGVQPVNSPDSQGSSVNFDSICPILINLNELHQQESVNSAQSTQHNHHSSQEKTPVVIPVEDRESQDLPLLDMGWTSEIGDRQFMMQGTETSPHFPMWDSSCSIDAILECESCMNQIK